MNAPPSELNEFFTVIPHSVTLVAFTATRIQSATPNRVAIVFGSSTAASFLIWSDSTVSATKGILVAANAIPLEFRYHDYGSLVGQEWWAYSSGMPTINWYEVIFGQGLPTQP